MQSLVNFLLQFRDVYQLVVLLSQDLLAHLVALVHLFEFFKFTPNIFSRYGTCTIFYQRRCGASQKILLNSCFILMILVSSTIIILIEWATITWTHHFPS